VLFLLSLVSILDKDGGPVSWQRQTSTQKGKMEGQFNPG
jgi:hypothetical protein